MLSYYDFQSLVCTSAKQYFDYLTEKQTKGILDSGRKVISVYQITSGRIPKEYVLSVSEKVFRPDECEIWVRNKQAIGVEILTTNTINRFTHSIRISDKNGYLDNINNLTPDDIKIVSDLRFLIKRLWQFYKYNQFNLLPPFPIDIPQLPDEQTDYLSEEQKNAVDSVFQFPVTYIHGAPGTGKTRAVLAQCILRYVIAKKRIFLLAPTNNAVEQMLRGVLPVLKDAGIDLECVYRIGTASESFAKEYPQVIGNTALESLLDNLLKQKSHYESEVDNIHKTQEQTQNLFIRLEKCRRTHIEVAGIASQLKVALTEIAELSNTLGKLYDQSKLTELEYEQTQKSENEAASDVSICRDNISLTQKQIDRLKHRFWKAKQRHQLEDDLRILLVSFPQYKAAHQNAISTQNQAREKWAAATQAHLDCLGKHNKLLACIENLRKRILTLVDADPDYKASVESSLSRSDYELGDASIFLTTLESQYQDSANQIDYNLYETYIRELQSIKDQLERIGSNAKINQKENALVLAGTIDSTLRDLIIPDNEADEIKEKRKIFHVFLDEAGYTCLAKGMAAFACGAPVTFLGDHKQLPPVCEMSRITEEFAPICLWALPIAYYPELIHGDFRDLYYRCYCRKDEPSFYGINYCSLNTSYRFGHGLAGILAKYIYTSKFHGVSDTPFEIQIIDAPFIAGTFTKSNQAEASAISDYLNHNPSHDFSILAPYRNQIKLLRRILPKDYKDNILTVHRSQGCEWDTVILSVTDTHKPFFTDSNLPIGRSVLNTAISRARRKLVIVCDVGVWSAKHGQIITELIETGAFNK